MLELAEPAAFNIQVSIQTVDAPDEKGTLQAGETVLNMPLPETKNHVKCIALQNAEMGVFKVKAIYLATEEYVNGSTGIRQMENAKMTIDNCKYLQNGRLVIMKNGESYSLDGKIINE